MQKLENRMSKVESEILREKAVRELEITTKVFDSVRTNEAGKREAHIIKKRTRSISDSVKGTYIPVDDWEKF